MTNGFNRLVDITLQTQVDLFDLLLEPGYARYPWNTADPESEAYFADQELGFLLEDWPEEEIAKRSQAFFLKLEEIWSVTINNTLHPIAHN